MCSEQVCNGRAHRLNATHNHAIAGMSVRPSHHARMCEESMRPTEHARLAYGPLGLPGLGKPKHTHSSATKPCRYKIRLNTSHGPLQPGHVPARTACERKVGGQALLEVGTAKDVAVRDLARQQLHNDSHLEDVLQEAGGASWGLARGFNEVLVGLGVVQLDSLDAT